MVKLIRHFGVIGCIGIVATTAYAAAMIWFVDGRWSDLQELRLNELGDFLAGAFGPLAILWLVLGYFQQGIELRQNSQALFLQAQELENSVKQQAELVSVSKEQLEHEKNIFAKQQEDYRNEAEAERMRHQPRLKLTVLGRGFAPDDSTILHRVALENNGATCNDVNVYVELGQDKIVPKKIPSLKTTENFGFSFAAPIDKIIAVPITVKCIDSRSNEYEAKFLISIKGNNIDSIDNLS